MEEDRIMSHLAYMFFLWAIVLAVLFFWADVRLDRIEKKLDPMHERFQIEENERRSHLG